MQDTFNLALLGNITTEFTGKALQSECNKYGIDVSIYNAPYQQYNQEAMDRNSSYYSSQPDLTLLMLDARPLYPHWFKFVTLAEINDMDRENQVQNAMDVLGSLIQTIHNNSKTKIIVNNFRVPYHVPFGVLDNRSGIGLKRMISVLNLTLEKFAAATDYAYIFDYNGFCSYIGHNMAVDSKMVYLTKSALSYPATKLLAREYMRYILPFMSMSKKCLVLDLDNTLWGGIAGEDGISGVRLDLSGPGKTYYDFQEEILNLYYKGILLAVNSKNNPEDAFDIMENHPHMLLRKKCFSCFKINWQDKVTNLKEIANELNIGLDSLVFFDDNPVERDYVKKALPQVTVINVPEDPGKYSDALNNNPEFEILELTDEDRKRNEMYEQNRERIHSQQLFHTMQEYLASLETAITVSEANNFNISRISQLTQKTNQFNMTTKRYQVSDIKSMLEAGDHKVYCCSVSDRFGDNGITGCCIVRLKGSTATIDTFLLSCRVLGRNVEYAFLAVVVKLLKDRNIKTISAEYLPTQKNRVNSSFYSKAGFSTVAAENGRTVFELKEDAMPVEVDYISCKIEYEE